MGLTRLAYSVAACARYGTVSTVPWPVHRLGLPCADTAHRTRDASRRASRDTRQITDTPLYQCTECGRCRAAGEECTMECTASRTTETRVVPPTRRTARLRTAGGTPTPRQESRPDRTTDSSQSTMLMLHGDWTLESHAFVYPLALPSYRGPCRVRCAHPLIVYVGGFGGGADRSRRTDLARQ